MTIVKICGITNINDALMAAELGVDALGFVFAESPRRVSPDQAVAISKELPPVVAKVGVFVDEDIERVRELAAACDLDLLQFHGSESPEYCAAFGCRAIKAFRMKDSSILNGLPQYGAGPYLLDAYSDNAPGGTGRTFDWTLAEKAKAYGRIILSGGLNPGNVGLAIATARPCGVDVGSGIEAAPGKKDPLKTQAFMRAVRQAEVSE